MEDITVDDSSALVTVFEQSLLCDVWEYKLGCDKLLHTSFETFKEP